MNGDRRRALADYIMRVMAVVVGLALGLLMPSGFSRRAPTPGDPRLAPLILLLLAPLALHGLLWWQWRRRSLRKQGVDRPSERWMAFVDWCSVGPPVFAIGAMALVLAAYLGAFLLPAGSAQGVFTPIVAMGGESLLWIAAGVLAPGVLLGRYVSLGLHCASCGYSAEGGDRYRCPECGAPLSLAESVTVGRRKRSKFVLIVAATLALMILATAPFAVGTPWRAWTAGEAPLPFTLSSLAASDPTRQGELWEGVVRRFPLTAADHALVVDGLLTALERNDPPRLHWAPLGWLSEHALDPVSPPDTLDRALAAWSRAPIGPAADALQFVAQSATLTEAQQAEVDRCLTARFVDSIGAGRPVVEWLAERLASGGLAPEHVDALRSVGARSVRSLTEQRQLLRLLAEAVEHVQDPAGWRAVASVAMSDIGRVDPATPMAGSSTRALGLAVRAGAVDDETLTAALRSGARAQVWNELMRGDLPAPTHALLCDEALTTLESGGVTGWLRSVWTWLELQRSAGRLSAEQGARLRELDRREGGE